MKYDWITKGTSDAGFAWKSIEDPESMAGRVDSHHTLKQIWFLERALARAPSIGRVVPPDGLGPASCFLVGPKLILTNNHVFEFKEDAIDAVIQFNYRNLPDGTLMKPFIEVKCDPSVFVTDKQLDFSLVGLKEAPAGIKPLKLGDALPPKVGAHVSIIQHPDGDPQQVAIRDNGLTFIDNTMVQYITNTEYGSSGSPVFNDFWQVIALHSQRVPDPKKPKVWFRNQGFRIERILENPEVDALINPS